MAGLLVLALLSTAMTGCRTSATVEWTNQTTSGTVNSSFVDVNGLLVAPTKVVMSYPTEELSLGNDGNAGVPQFLDGVLYTFSYVSGNENAWMTAWNQTTGDRLWSVDTGLRWVMTLVSDGEHLFPHSSNTFYCLDKKTGATVWKNTLEADSPYVFGLSGEIVLHTNMQNNIADRVYVLGTETKNVDAGSEQRNPGIYILDGANGKLLGRIDWPALILSNGKGELLCDGTTLYASMPESTKAEYPAQKSSLVAFDLTTNKILWQESVDGEGSNLVKQGNTMVFIRSAAFIDDWIDVWQIGDTTASATRLWTRKIGEKQSAYHVFPFAVNSAFVYLQGEQGTLMALDLTSGKEAWNHQFAPIKEPITEGPDMGKEHDTYQLMTMTAARDALYVQDGGGLLSVFDPATGKELWSKRISHVILNQTSVANAFVMQVVDKGFYIIASDGKVDLWK
jgi:outer membrane protein assembly factor BamB